MGWITDMHDSLLSRDDEHARDEAQAELFRTYLTDQYADDGDVTLNLTSDAAFTDAGQLRQFRLDAAQRAENDEDFPPFSERCLRCGRYFHEWLEDCPNCGDSRWQDETAGLEPFEELHTEDADDV